MLVSPRNYASYSIFFFGVYDTEMTSVFTHLIRPGQTVWDVGTERGWFSLLMGKLVGNNGRVDSFEAFPPNFKNFEANVKLNKMSWIRMNDVAVSEKRSRMWFVPPSDSVTHDVSFLNDCSGVGYLTEKYQEGAIEVPTISLDDYYEEQKIERVSLIKIDIEGAEVSSLKGAKNLILKDRPIIAIEFNRDAALRAGSSVEELNELLISYGYKLYLFERRFVRFNLDNYKNQENLVLNVYCFAE